MTLQPPSLPSLLLLPPVAAAITSASLSAAYRTIITDVVSTLSKLPKSSELIIVLYVPTIHQYLDKPRSVIYDDMQHLLAGVYSLFCVICANLSVDVESITPGSIDARVILLDPDFHAATAGPNTGTCGPITNLSSFTSHRRHWNLIFTVDDESGKRLLAQFKESANRSPAKFEGTFQAVGGGDGTSSDNEVPVSLSSHQRTSVSHHVVAVGGTFDHIHAGHKLLLTATALLLQPSSEHRRLIVGITGDELLKNKKYAQYLGTWTQRQDDVVRFLLSILLFSSTSGDDSIRVTTLNDPVPNGRATHTLLVPHNITIECVEIQDPFGPTITDESVTALVVSGETRSGGQAVNAERNKKGWSSLQVFEIDVLDASDTESPSKTEDFASKISSTAIRKRLADNSRTSSL